MIKKDRVIITLEEKILPSVFKILPLYEKDNKFLLICIESLLFKLYGLDKVIPLNSSSEYVSAIAILETLKEKIEQGKTDKTVVKREIFNCMNEIKNLISNLEDGE